MSIEKEVLEVKELGDRIGYGNMMTIATALWRKSLKDNGYPQSGAFIGTIYDLLSDEGKEIADKELPVYDRMVDNVV